MRCASTRCSTDRRRRATRMACMRPIAASAVVAHAQLTSGMSLLPPPLRLPGLLPDVRYRDAGAAARSSSRVAGEWLAPDRPPARRPRRPVAPPAPQSGVLLHLSMCLMLADGRTADPYAGRPLPIPDGPAPGMPRRPARPSLRDDSMCPAGGLAPPRLAPDLHVTISAGVLGPRGAVRTGPTVAARRLESPPFDRRRPSGPLRPLAVR